MAKVLMKGNEAIGEAAIRAGCKNYFAYPITPQTEVAEYLSKRLAEVGGVFLQGESEVAVSYMIFGASACGERVFTTSSSPGVSLMSEGISYITAAECPAVFVNIEFNQFFHFHPQGTFFTGNLTSNGFFHAFMIVISFLMPDWAVPVNRKIFSC